jgi:hypothetical protein
MTRRSMALVAALGPFSTACLTPYAIQPVTGGAVGTASNAELTIRVDPGAWHGQPWDLATYLTPLSIDIVSRDPRDIWLSYSDFALVDEFGLRYRVISPYRETAGPPRGQPAPGLSAPPAPPRSEPRDQGNRPDDGGLDDSWRQDIVPDTAPEPTSHVGTSANVWLVSYPGQIERRLGFTRPRYGPFVDPWDERYYPEGPSYDVIRLGLSEGMLSRGERISGFVYFQNAAAHAGRVDLSWTARTTDGTPVASLTVSLVVVD